MEKMLKADLHLHTNDDPKHQHIQYSAKELISICAKRGYNVISITNHNVLTWSRELDSQAKEEGVLLIPGVEATVEGRHVLFYNFDVQDLRRLVSLQAILRLKKKNNLVVAPHPYFLRFNCLGHRLEENIEAFDAIEYSHFYTWWLNRNHKAERVAEQHRLPLISNSDAHSLLQLGKAFSYIDAEPSLKDVVTAIKQGKVRVQTKPLSTVDFLRIAARLFTESPTKHTK